MLGSIASALDGLTDLFTAARQIEVKRAQPRNPRDGNPMDVRSIDSSFATAGAQGSKYVNPTGYHNNNFNNNRGFMGAGQAAPYPNMASSMPYGMPGFGGVGGMNQMSGGMGGTAFDPQAMAMMYQRMLSSEFGVPDGNNRLSFLTGLLHRSDESDAHDEYAG